MKVSHEPDHENGHAGKTDPNRHPLERDLPAAPGFIAARDLDSRGSDAGTRTFHPDARLRRGGHRRAGPSKCGSFSTPTSNTTRTTRAISPSRYGSGSPMRRSAPAPDGFTIEAEITCRLRGPGSTRCRSRTRRTTPRGGEEDPADRGHPGIDDAFEDPVQLRVRSPRSK